MEYIEDKELYDKIDDAIGQLRPFFEADQGDIRLVGIDRDMIVRIELLGACKTCSISSFTKAGIEDAVKRVAPEIISVEAIKA